MIKKLPAGWVQAKLGDITHISSEKVEPVKMRGARYLSLEHIQSGTREIISEGDGDSVRSTKNVFHAGDVLFGKLRPYLNKVCRPDFSGVCSTDILVFQESSALINELLLYFLTRPEVIAYTNLRSKGINLPRISAVDLQTLELHLPPLDEQRRIADKICRLVAHSYSVRKHLDAILPLLKQFRASVLSVAISGKLTQDWRKKQGIGAGWVLSDVQSVASVGTGSTPLRSNPDFFAPKGTPWITSSATAFPVVMKAEEYVTDDAIIAHRLKIFPVGSLLVAMYGEGKTRGQVTELGIKAAINQACAGIIVNEKIVLKAFVKLSLQANYLEMRELAEGGNQPNLNLSKIKAFPLRIPSLKEQKEIVHRVETFSRFADAVKKQVEEATALEKSLAQSILAKAFRGELVPQNPKDEPATELLKRIAVEREKMESDKKAKPRGRRKSD